MLKIVRNIFNYSNFNCFIFFFFSLKGFFISLNIVSSISFWWEKTPYYNYKKLFSFIKSVFFLRMWLCEMHGQVQETFFHFMLVSKKFTRQTKSAVMLSYDKFLFYTISTVIPEYRNFFSFTLNQQSPQSMEVSSILWLDQKSSQNVVRLFLGEYMKYFQGWFFLFLSLVGGKFYPEIWNGFRLAADKFLP